MSSSGISNISGQQLGPNTRRKTAKSIWFNLDNGSGTTIDDVILAAVEALTITDARIVYVDATSGTVAAGNVKVGTTVGGAEIVAATAYANSATVGTTTAMTLVNAKVPAGTMISVRHTGVAATAAGQAFVQIEYMFDK